MPRPPGRGSSVAQRSDAPARAGFLRRASAAELRTPSRPRPFPGSLWTGCASACHTTRVAAAEVANEDVRSPSVRAGALSFALQDVDVKHLPLLARCLTGPVLRHVLEGGRSAFLAEAFRITRADEKLGGDATLLTAAQAIFELVSRRYRSDYVYRTAIANKIFLGRHSPATTALLSELRVWRCKADLVMLNGTSTAYEIKTELDNFDRLAAQIAAYSRMFDRIFVVTYEDQVKRLQSCLPDFVGIITLSEAFTLRVRRDAVSNAHNVHVPTILDALRRGELVELTRRICGAVPSVSGVQLVGECTRLLLAQNCPRKVHDEMVVLLKKRRTFSRQDFDHVPRELVPAYLDSGIASRDWPRLTAILANTTVKEALHQ